MPHPPSVGPRSRRLTACALLLLLILPLGGCAVSLPASLLLLIQNEKTKPQGTQTPEPALPG